MEFSTLGSVCTISKMDNSTKAAFAKRLRDEMVAQGYEAPRSDLRADAAVLQTVTGVRSLEAARKWLSGTSLPRPDVIQKIADWLGVRVAWLRDGEGPKILDTKIAESIAVYHASASIPVIAWAESKKPNPIAQRTAEDSGEWLQVPIPHSHGAYALRVISDALTGFSRGDYLIVSQDKAPEAGNYVIASLANLPEPILLPVIAFGGALFLEATAVGYRENIPLEDATVHGVVTLTWRVLVP